MESIGDYNIQHKMQIAWGDMDILGHVNNVTYFRYFDIIRSKYLLDTGCFSLFKELNIQAVIKSYNCHFLKPLSYPEEIVLASKIITYNKNLLLMEYVVFSESTGITTFAESELVIIDLNTASSVEVPESVLSLIKHFENNG